MIDPQTELMIEEVLLGYLRSSKQIKLEECEGVDVGRSKIYTLKFVVDQDFAITLAKPLTNKFLEFFNSEDKFKPITEITPHRQRGKD